MSGGRGSQSQRKRPQGRIEGKLRTCFRGRWIGLSSGVQRRSDERKRKEEEARRKEAEKLARELADRQRRDDEAKRKEAARLAKENAQRQKREEEERRKEAERRARGEAELRRRQEEERKKVEENAQRDAERLSREQAVLRRRQEEERRRADDETRREADRKAREESDRRRKEEEENRRIEELRRREAERLASEEAERKRKQEEEARKQFLILEKARKEAEKVAREQAALRLKEEEERKQELERKAKEEADRKARELEEQRRLQEEERKRAERLAREQAELKRREEEERVREQETIAREQAERQRKLEEERRRTEEFARREAERRARDLEEQKRVAQEKARREMERLSKEQEERKRLEEESRTRNQQRLAREEADRKRKLEEERTKAEEESRRQAERRAREEVEQRKLEEEKRREIERRTKEEERRRMKEQEELRKREERAKMETVRAKPPAPKPAEAPPVQAAPAKVEAPRPPTPTKAPSGQEGRKRDREIIAALRDVKVRFPTSGSPLPPTWRTLERYPVNSPFAYTVIAESPLSAKRYFLDEVPLTKIEAGIYSYLLDALEDELTVPRTEVNPRQYFADQARRILLKYSIRVPATSWAKILYYAERDLVGFGVIDGLMRDPNIEDISLDAVGKPIFIYHKGHENLETNITLGDDESLDSIVTRLSHMAGKHVSTAFPIVQGTLPGRHRLVATFRREVSPLGSSATIRKFREDPLTIIDMLNLKLMDHKLAAYAWLMMQNRATGIVVGATGAGKTTLLNALLTLTRLNTKVVTIEEVQEINIPHQNWTSLVARESYAATEERAGAVDLFELVKAAMRMRPDILVVGEVRGEEAYVLFQALSTGHGGVCTLHSDDTASALQRLTSEPMNVPASFIPFLDLSFVVRRISIPTPEGGFRSTRRIISVDEVTHEHESNNIFRWEPRTDTYAAASFEKSGRIEKIAKDNGVRVSEVVKEIDRRSVVLHWLQQRGIRNFKEVSPILEIYASRPEETYGRALNDLQAAGVVAPSASGNP